MIDIFPFFFHLDFVKAKKAKKYQAEINVGVNSSGLR